MNTNEELPFEECSHDDCMDEECKPLYLTREEILFIDDQLTMMIERDGSAQIFSTVRPVLANAGLPAPVELLDKVGMAVLQITDDDALWDAQVPIQVTATDLYMLRELARSTVKFNGKFVGFTLKKKIYKLLYEAEYQKERNLEKLLADVDMQEHTSESQLDWRGESG